VRRTDREAKVKELVGVDVEGFISIEARKRASASMSAVAPEVALFEA
jgi:hypothetical protein